VIDGKNIDCIPNKKEIELFIDFYNWEKELFTDFYDWDFFYNVENMPNQTLISEAIEYFETGTGKGFFEPLDALNWIWKCSRYVNNNLNKPITDIVYLNNLQLTDKQRHILYCFLIKWAGGYPIGSRGQFKTTYNLIVKEFLKYPEDTPEKEFCKNKGYFEYFEEDFTQETDYEWRTIKFLEERVKTLEKGNITIPTNKRISELEQELTTANAEIERLTANAEIELTTANAEIERLTVNAEIERLTANAEIEPMSDEGEQSENKNTGILKVQTVVLLEILKKAGISKKDADLSKIVRIISYLISKSEKKIYNEANKGISFTKFHTPEIDKVNNLLSDVNAGISIEKDKEY
jgi:hypothetical protein